MSASRVLEKSLFENEIKLTFHANNYASGNCSSSEVVTVNYSAEISTLAGDIFK